MVNKYNDDDKIFQVLWINILLYVYRNLLKPFQYLKIAVLISSLVIIVCRSDLSFISFPPRETS